LTNSFHGRTITTLAATGQAAFHQDFLPLTEGFVYADPTVESLKGQLNRGDIGAILFEVVQGEGGVLPLAQEFVDFMRDIAQKDDILLIADEVQIGNGRSGQLFGYMHYNLTPDIVSTAKGLGGGLPLGATLLGEKVKDVLGAGSHGSTFGGNPVCCAGALSVINRIDDDLLKEVKEKSAYIIEELSNSKGVKSISGLGLMLGIETATDASDVIKKCMDKGVLVIKAKHKVRLLPALNIPWEDLKTAVDIIKSVCAETA
jgi:acetylornithine/N-succinyldiaminopimelate aminotransferase